MSHQDVPPIGPTLGVSKHLHRCPLCGGPNPHLADPAPPPEPVRPPTAPPHAQPPHLAAPPPEFGAKAPDPYGALDSPLVGGRLTVFVLCYGPHADLARRCVSGVLATVPPHRLDLRVAANAPCADTVSYLHSVGATRLYLHKENRLKYPVMREVLRDPACPVTTPYFVWFDDDSYPVDPLWAVRLAEAVHQNHRFGVRLYGTRFCHDLANYRAAGMRADAWFREAPWWRGVPFGTPADETPSPSGSCVHFVAGGFWALEHAAALAADVPDARLAHNGGDITVGEQVRQAGFRTLDFNRGKTLVHTSGAPRRGHSEQFPWARR